MNFRSLMRTYNRLSLPKKVACGVAAFAGVGALIGIPVLSLNPVRPPTVINEDAYYKSQIKDQSLGGENIAPSQPANINTTAPAEIPVDSSQSAQMPVDSSKPAQIPIDSSKPDDLPIDSSKSASISGSNSSLGSNSFGPDTSDIPSNIGENSPRLSRIGTAGNTNNPYSKSMSSSYTPSGSLSANPYNASTTVSSPGNTTLNTRYSLPIPASANSYSLQPSQGNVYTKPNSGADSDSQKNSLPAAGTLSSTTSGASEDSNQPLPTTSAGSSKGGNR